MCLLEKDRTVSPILSAILIECGCQAIDKLASDVSVYICTSTCMVVLECGEPE